MTVGLSNRDPLIRADVIRATRMTIRPIDGDRFDRIDAGNATIVFSAGPFKANLKQPGRQGQRMTETPTYPYLARRPRVAT